MRRDARAYLWDIQHAVDGISKFLTGVDFDAYAQSELLQAAVERKFEIIGEALAQLSKSDPKLAARVPDVRDVIAFRNVLIHGYATIDHRRVWHVIQESLPGLRAAVTALLGEFR